MGFIGEMRLRGKERPGEKLSDFYILLDKGYISGFPWLSFFLDLFLCSDLPIIFSPLQFIYFSHGAV